MKTTILNLLILLLIVSNNISYAQWQTDVRLTNNTAGSFTSDINAKCVASDGNYVHVVWQDTRDGNSEIYYKRSTDKGLSWETDKRLTNDLFQSNYPSITVLGSVVHVVWYPQVGFNFEIYYKRSTDLGVTWSTDVRLTDDPASSFSPCVSASGSDVHVVWRDTRDGANNSEIYYKRSTDEGVSWGTDTRLTFNTYTSNGASVSSSGSTVHVVWDDHRDIWPEIYYKRSTDRGATWGPDTRLTVADLYNSFLASSCVSSSDVHIAWTEASDFNYEIYYIHSSDGGTTWGEETRLTYDDSVSRQPTICASGDGINVVWEDFRDGNLEIYNKRSTDRGTTWGADTRLTNNSAVSEFTSISGSGSVAHIVWRDIRDGNYEIYYKRDPNGNPIGITNISSEIPEKFSLSQNYPNPFNPSTVIRFDVPSNVKGQTSDVRLVIYNAIGREVSTLVNEKLSAGSYEVEFNAANYMSGVYFYQIQAGNSNDVKKMILIK